MRMSQCCVKCLLCAALMVMAVATSFAVPGTETYVIKASFLTLDGKFAYVIDYCDAGPDGVWDCGGDYSNTTLTNVNTSVSGHVSISNVVTITLEDHSNGNITAISQEYGKETYGIPDVSNVPVVGIKNAFSNCANVESVSIAGGMSVEDHFTGCSSLEAIVFADESTYLAKRETLPQARVGSGDYWEDASTGIRWFVTSTNGGLRVDAAVGATGVVTIPTFINGTNVTSIGSRAFYGIDGITEIVVPVTVTKIEDGSFSNCTDLAEIEFKGDPPECEESSISTGVEITHPDTTAWESAFSDGTWNGCSESGESSGSESGSDGGSSSGTSAVTATTPEFRLSIKHDGVRASAGKETLRYSTLWDGGSNETAKVTITQNGTTLVENLTGEGDQAWRVATPGTYILTHTTYTNGTIAKTLTATFIVSLLPVPEDLRAEFDGFGVVTNTGDSYAVTITNDHCGTITLPDNLGTVVMDLQGHMLKGDEMNPPGRIDEWEFGEGSLLSNGIDVVHVSEEGSATFLLLSNSCHNVDAQVQGNGARRSGISLTGGDGVCVASDARIGTCVAVGTDIHVSGAENRAGVSVGAGIRGDVRWNNGTIVGGLSAGTALTDPALPGGDGVCGNVGENHGIILGGYGAGGGDGASNNYPGGIAVRGDVGYNDGEIRGGDAHDESATLNLPGGVAVTGNVGTNDGVIVMGRCNTSCDARDDVDWSEWNWYDCLYGDKLTDPEHAAVGGDILVHNGFVSGTDGMLAVGGRIHSGTGLVAKAVVASARLATNVLHYTGSVIKPEVVVMGDCTPWHWPASSNTIINEGGTEIGSYTVTLIPSNALNCAFAAEPVTNGFAYVTNRWDELQTLSWQIVSGEVAPGGEEPGPGEIPVGGLSKLDATYVYDGLGHTINTQALYAIALAGATPSFSFSLESNGVYQTAPFVYTNVGEYVCWYKIEAANYEPFVHQAKLTIYPKPGLSAMSARQRYPWNGMVDLVFTVTGIATQKYEVTFSAQDVAGDTNLTMVTLFDDSGAPVAAASPILPGTYRWSWNAASDMPDGLTCERMSVKGTVAEHKPSFMVVDLSGGASATSYPVSWLDTVPNGGWTDEYKTTKLVLRRIPAGAFTMGSPTDEIGRAECETQHVVTISRDYYVGVFQVTGRQYSLVMGSNPSDYSGATHPVQCVCYNYLRGSTAGSQWPSSSAVDAESFMGRIRARTANDCFDLPTEAEWEYACRAGTTTSLNSGKNVAGGDTDANLDEVGCYFGTSGSGPVPVGSFAENAYGLFDMHGNVWEICLDWYGDYSDASSVDPKGSATGTRRCVRGGSSYEYANGCRSATRGSMSPSYAWDYRYGFRLALRPQILNASGAVEMDSATATTPEFRLSLKADAVRASAGDETLRYSSLWDGGSNETAKVTIAQNGTTLVENLTGEGDRAWRVTQNGTYELTHTTYTNGAVAAVLSATFVVTGKDVPFPEGDVTVTGHSGKYDGEGHGITVTAPEGATVRYARSAEGPYGANPSFTNVCGATTIWCEVTKAGYIPYTNSATVVINKREVTLTSGSGARAYNGFALTNWTYTVSGDDFVGDEGVTCTYSGTQTIVGSSKNAFDYALKSGTSADNYTISKIEGDLEVTASEIVNPFDPDDPTKPVTPEALAKANCVTNYDGDGHSIEVVPLLNPLIAANNPQVTYSLLQNGTYEAQNPVFTNVVSTSVWYRIAADNFKPFTTNAFLTIAPRSITKATIAAIADQTYTGSAIAPVPAVSDERTLIGATEPTNIITTVDYEVLYADNVNVGVAKIILAGTNNYEGVVTNTFTITAAPIPFDPTVGIMATGYTNEYDGAAHGITVTATGLKTTPTVQYKSSATGSWQNASPTYTDVCDMQVWWKVSAPNYQTVEGTIGLKITQTANEWAVTPAIEGWTYGEAAKTPVGAARFGAVAFAYDPTPVGDAGEYTMTASVAGTANYTGLSKDVSFTIAKKTIPGGGDEPGGGEVPTGGLSKYDVTMMYDGAEHTIDTNALVQAFKTVIDGDFEVRYCAGAPTSASAADATERVPPAWKDVVATSLWYKVTSPNYNDFVHQAKVTVTNRCVTLASQPRCWTYDGDWHSNTVATCTSENDFVAGETVSTNFAARIRDVGTVPNAFDIVWDGTALASNYALTLVTNDLTVTAVGSTVTVTITGRVTTVVYDGAEKSVSGYDVVSISDPLYRATDFRFTGVAATNGTDAGTYPMGLKPSDFVNTNGNFSSVTFSVTDGSLVIARAENAWTTTPAIEGWTYGEAAKTPVGAARFGAVAFAYDPTPVGDAGEYTMTASVAGTANYTGLSKDVSFTIAKKTIPGGGDEPGGGEVPTGGLSKYDVTMMYDGAEHTIDTNALVQAFKTVVIGTGDTRTWYVRARDADGAVAPASGWASVPPAFTNACEEVVWYKVTNPNQADYVHQAKVTITNRPISVTSASGTWVFDAMAHETNGVEEVEGVERVEGVEEVEVDEGVEVETEGGVVRVGLIGDDTLELSGFPSITEVGTKPNAFTWAFGAGTLATNYCVSVATGTLTVVRRSVASDDGRVAFSAIPDQVYAPEGVEPEVEMTFDGRACAEGVDYEVAYADNDCVGTATAIVTGLGSFTGRREIPFQVLPLAGTAGGYVSYDLERDLGVVIDADYEAGDVASVKIEGLVKGLALTVTQMKRAVSKKKYVVTNAVYTLAGVPSGAVDYEAQPMFARVVVTRVDKTKVETLQRLRLGIAAIPVATLPDGLLGAGYAASVTSVWPDVTAAWAVKGLPKGLAYTPKLVATKNEKKKTVTTNALPFTVYGKPAQAGTFTVSATRTYKVGKSKYTETRRATLSVWPSAAESSYRYVDPAYVSLGASRALPSAAKASGLPTGVKFNAKLKVLYGTPTKPGVYAVAVTRTDKTVDRFLWRVTPGANEGMLKFASWEVHDATVCAMQGASCTNWTAAVPSGAKVTVSGLPKGLSFVQNKATGVWGFVGAPTAAGNYVLTFKTVRNGVTVVERIAMSVEANPWKGTWQACQDEGYGGASVVATVSVAAGGGVSMSLTEASSNATVKSAASAKALDASGGAVTLTWLRNKKSPASRRTCALDFAHGTVVLDGVRVASLHRRTTATAARDVTTFVLSGGSGAETNLYAYLSAVYSAKKGVFVVTGKLGDGTTVKASTYPLERATPSDGLVLAPFLVTDKARNAVYVELSDDGGSCRVLENGAAVEGILLGSAAFAASDLKVKTVVKKKTVYVAATVLDLSQVALKLQMSAACGACATDVDLDAPVAVNGLVKFVHVDELGGTWTLETLPMETPEGLQFSGLATRTRKVKSGKKTVTEKLLGRAWTTPE